MLKKWWRWVAAIVVGLLVLLRIKKRAGVDTLVETQKEIEEVSAAKSANEIKTAVSDHQNEIKTLGTIETVIRDATLDDLAAMAEKEFER